MGIYAAFLFDVFVSTTFLLSRLKNVQLKQLKVRGRSCALKGICL